MTRYSTETTSRPTRNWVSDVLVIAGILALGYFSLMIEQRPQPTIVAEQPVQ